MLRREGVVGQCGPHDALSPLALTICGIQWVFVYLPHACPHASRRAAYRSTDLVRGRCRGAHSVQLSQGTALSCSFLPGAGRPRTVVQLSRRGRCGATGGLGPPCGVRRRPHYKWGRRALLVISRFHASWGGYRNNSASSSSICPTTSEFIHDQLRAAGHVERPGFPEPSIALRRFSYFGLLLFFALCDGWLFSALPDLTTEFTDSAFCRCSSSFGRILLAKSLTALS